MSRTYRKYNYLKMFRHPRGRKQALLNDVRKGAIPPDPWDDIFIKDESQLIWKVAYKLYRRGVDEESIKSTLKKKFNMSSDEIEHLLVRLRRCKRVQN